MFIKHNIHHMTAHSYKFYSWTVINIQNKIQGKEFYASFIILKTNGSVTHVTILKVAVNMTDPACFFGDSLYKPDSSLTTPIESSTPRTTVLKERTREMPSTQQGTQVKDTSSGKPDSSLTSPRESSTPGSFDDFYFRSSVTKITQMAYFVLWIDHFKQKLTCHTIHEN